MAEASLNSLPHGIKGFLVEPPWWQNPALWKILLGLAAAGLLLGLLWRYLKKRRQETLSPPQAVLNPYDACLERLHALDPSAVRSAADEAQYYHVLSDCLKIMLSTRLRRHVQAEVDELCVQRHGSFIPLSREELLKMEEFFATAQLIKYGHVSQGMDAARTAREKIFSWCEQLKVRSATFVPAAGEPKSW